MTTQNTTGLYLLLEDYNKSLSERIQANRTAQLAPDAQPIWLLLEEYPSRLQWHGRKGAVSADLPPSDCPLPDLLLEQYNPIKRYQQARGDGNWPLDNRTAFDPVINWSAKRLHHWTYGLRAASMSLHIALLALLMFIWVPQLDLEKPIDWTATRITLMTPSLDDISLPMNKAEELGDGDAGFRGLPQPLASTQSDERLNPDGFPTPESAPSSEIIQPVEVRVPEPETVIAALEETIAPEEEEKPAALSPTPESFQRGRELAMAGDSRLLPMPKAPQQQRARLQLEDPKAMMPGRVGDPQIGSLELTARPDQVVQRGIEKAIRQGGGRQVVGDGVGGLTSGIHIPSAPGNSGSLIELLSDAQGVDFRPYLTQILAAVRRNWFAVIPESARLGVIRGRTLLQFSVARNGSVPKLVIASSSGTPPLDRAAVAGVSASNPFPPLPVEYKGTSIRLQFTFLYNIQNP